MPIARRRPALVGGRQRVPQKKKAEPDRRSPPAQVLPSLNQICAGTQRPDNGLRYAARLAAANGQCDERRPRASSIVAGSGTRARRLRRCGKRRSRRSGLADIRPGLPVAVPVRQTPRPTSVSGLRPSAEPMKLTVASLKDVPSRGRQARLGRRRSQRRRRDRAKAPLKPPLRSSGTSSHLGAWIVAEADARHDRVVECRGSARSPPSSVGQATDDDVDRGGTADADGLGRRADADDRRGHCLRQQNGRRQRRAASRAGSDGWFSYDRSPRKRWTRVSRGHIKERAARFSARSSDAHASEA